MDWIIGGAEQVGNGWKMLMQCPHHRAHCFIPASVSVRQNSPVAIPALHARIRKQFNLPIGEFEGIEEPLAV